MTLERSITILRPSARHKQARKTILEDGTIRGADRRRSLVSHEQGMSFRGWSHRRLCGWRLALKGEADASLVVRGAHQEAIKESVAQYRPIRESDSICGRHGALAGSSRSRNASCLKTTNDRPISSRRLATSSPTTGHQNESRSGFCGPGSRQIPSIANEFKIQ